MADTRSTRLKTRIGRLAAAALAAIACSVVVTAGCTKSAETCVTAQCDQGNICIATADEQSSGDKECRFPCATHTDCPFNYHCDANTGGSSPYCVINTVTFVQKSGQFGASCKPTGGLANNPDCDVADDFWCNGTSPTDADAICTLFGCVADTDCGGGFYCGSVNKFPNVGSSKLQDGETWSACLPRAYCAPCAGDIDCGPANGAPQHCVTGTDNATYCAPECSSNTQCQADAQCLPYGNFDACTPRAGVCKGDGSLCSPCRADNDCTNGYCLLAYNSPEKFCSVKSGVACSVDTATSTLVAQCPTTSTATKEISCSLTEFDPEYPASQCIGTVVDGLDDNDQPEYVPGCWTRR
jgi:hypothetical protein